MGILERLNEVNDVTILDVNSPEFASYGKILHGYDFSEIISYMENNTDIPENGNVYVASVEDMESKAIYSVISEQVYGGMPIEIGYCNGRNSTYNGYEYHKGSEINVAVTDFMLCLGHSYDIENNCYDSKKAQVFFVPKGTAIEMYQTTLHLSPLKISDEGFKGLVILPRGTNTPLSDETKAEVAKAKEAFKNGEKNLDIEKVLLLQKNKWVIAHPDRKPLIDQGAYPGFIGENKELYY